VLKLFEHDIGGHALHFMVSVEGVLRLESVFMKSSPPEFSRSDVREWLNRVEDDFADNHRVVELANPVELPDTSWRCPLHWLQTFSNDGTYDDDARAPVPTRNSHFAHPTVLGFVRSIIARETACTKRSGRMQRSSECAGWRWLGGDRLWRRV
jgi:hypothetical protein